jgi:ribulose 1,5-bisphosphate synthetase/thiazole synthase
VTVPEAGGGSGGGGMVTNSLHLSQEEASIIYCFDKKSTTEEGKFIEAHVSLSDCDEKSTV